jgi:biotin operon repressor
MSDKRRKIHRRAGGAKSPVWEGALELASLGLRVFPLHHADAGGACSCGRLDCDSVAKHPWIRQWQAKATSDQSQIDAWWRKWPKANVAVATGHRLLVVDIDRDEGEQFAEEMGLPSTACVATSRGRHHYYCGDGPSRIGVRPGVDVRGDGGYVVAPPSMHATGVEYQWIVPLTRAFEVAPDWTTHRVVGPERTARRDGQANPRVDAEQLHEGQRNEGLFRLGGSMRSVGMSQREIEAALKVANEEQCVEPLTGTEVSEIATSVAKYPPGRRIDKTLLVLGLGPYATTVYLAIRSSCNHENRCFHSYESLVDATGIGRSTVWKAVKALEEAGLIHVERRGFDKRTGTPQCNIYTLLDPETANDGNEGTWTAVMKAEDSGEQVAARDSRQGGTYAK